MITLCRILSEQKHHIFGSAGPHGAVHVRARAPAFGSAEATEVTLMNQRFVALHMMWEKIAPDDPTRAPATIEWRVLEREANLSRCRPPRVAVRRRDASPACRHRRWGSSTGAAEHKCDGRDSVRRRPNKPSGHRNDEYDLRSEHRPAR